MANEKKVLEQGKASVHDLTKNKGISLKVVLFCFMITVGLAYVNQMQLFAARPTSVSVERFSYAAVAALLLAMLLRGFVSVKRIELIYVFAIVNTVAIATWTLVGFALSNAIGLSKYYLVGEYVEWFERYPPVIVPQSKQVMMDLWVGGVSVPWADWIFPIILWTLYFTAFFWLILVAVRCFQGSWVRAERMQYPLTRPVLDIVGNETEDDSKKEVIWKSLPWLVGLSIALLLGLHGWLSTVVPAIEPIPYWIRLMDKGFNGGNLNHHMLAIHIDPMMLGVALLLPLDLSFSFVFFFFTVIFGAGLYVENLGILYNRFPVFRDFYYSIKIAGVGGCLVYSIILIRAFINYLRNDKEHYLKSVVNSLGGKTLFMSLSLASLLYLGLFGVFLLKSTAILIAMDIVYFLIGAVVLARFRAQLGFPESPHVERFPVVGTWALGSGTAEKLGMHGHLLVHTRDHGPLAGSAGLAGDSYYLVESQGGNTRSLTKWLMILFPVVFAVAFAFALSFVYENGFNMANASISNMGWSHANWFIRNIFRSDTNVPMTWAVMGLGALATLGLYVLYIKLVAWPFHPIALLAVLWGRAHVYWSMFFVAWLLKFFMTRWMGYTNTNKVVTRLASGLIIGAAIDGLFFTILKAL